MRVAIYDRYWSTAGGGERYAAGVAEALVDRHDVVLFAHHEIDLDELGELLHVDLTGVGVEIIDSEPLAVEAASATVDLFVNASYTSRARSRARRGLYIVHFPGPTVAFPRWARPLVSVGRRLIRDDGINVEYGSGFHEPEWLLQRQGSWAAGDASLSLDLPPGSHTVTLDLVRMPPAPLASVEVHAEAHQSGRILAEGHRVVTAPPRPWSKRVQPMSLRLDTAGSEPVDVSLRTAEAVEVAGRPLGVALVGVRVGSGVAARARAAFPLVSDRRRWSGFAASYDRIVANSEFTRTHVERRWHTTATVLEPPVTMHRATTKRQVILTVGRFFPSTGGHSKKQAEMVAAFRRLCERVGDGWELHLVGGVSADGVDYLREVRRAGQGLPVHIHENASGAELAGLYGEASIYWHAAGLGEDAERHPDRLEHFGISTVEAMSAGAVPVVYAAGGLLETVQHGRSGLHWHTAGELIDSTAALVADPDRLAALADAACAQARQWSAETFRGSVNDLIAELAS